VAEAGTGGGDGAQGVGEPLSGGADAIVRAGPLVRLQFRGTVPRELCAGGLETFGDFFF
jgi:hypothetical protein